MNTQIKLGNCAIMQIDPLEIYLMNLIEFLDTSNDIIIRAIKEGFNP